MRKRLMIAFLVLVFVIFLIVIIGREAQAPEGQNKEQPQQTSKPAGFDKSRYSLEDPASLWVVVNKQRSLPSDYVPNNLIAAGNGELMRQNAAQSLAKLRAAAATDGVYLRVISGYRSFATQQSTYNSYVASDGQAQADTYSARPGHSEHQTGLGVDLGNSDGNCDLAICFGNTAGGQWLAENAHKFGFFIRYQDGKTNITGYQPEPWHLRYASKDLAKEIYDSGQTMEEFFGLPAAPGY